jgi:signal transduction histidine kinase/ActR/RegA family two-component response regulator
MQECLLEKFSSKQFLVEFIAVSKKINAASNNIEINSILQELVNTSLDAEFSSIWYYDESKFTLLRERSQDHVRELDLSNKKGIIYKCFMTKESSLYNYLASDKDYVASIDNPDNIRMKSKIMLPLIDGDNIVGIVTAYNSVNKNKKFFKEDMKVLEALSPYIIDILYKMHTPEKENKKSNNIESQAVEKMQKIQDDCEHKENPDDILTFVSSFVHDIRTPANTLYGFLDLLEDQIEDPRLKSYLNNAKESALFINEMTTSVLDLVSNHKEGSQSVIEEIDTVKFFASIARSFSSNMYSKHITFNIYIDPLLPKTIEIDALKIKRVLLNLLGNAYKFTPNNSTIEYVVRYTQNTKKIAFSIEDTGIGIAKEKQKDIFGAFEQASDTTTLNYGGTGLGLFISAQYVKNMGGELHLSSAVDEGSIFSFELPVKIANEESSFNLVGNKTTQIAIVMDKHNGFSANNIARYIARMGISKECIKPYKNIENVDPSIAHIIIFQNKIDYKALHTAAKNGKKILLVEEEMFSIDQDQLCETCNVISEYEYIAKELYKFINTQVSPKVLVVDDDEISVLLIQNILEDEFCELSIARNGKEALELTLESYRNNAPFSLMYIDNEMPLMNGTEAVRKIREYEKDNNLKGMHIVSTSGNTLHSAEDKENFDFIVGKPFKKDDIKKVLYHVTQRN